MTITSDSITETFNKIKISAKHLPEGNAYRSAILMKDGGHLALRDKEANKIICFINSESRAMDGNAADSKPIEDTPTLELINLKLTLFAREVTKMIDDCSRKDREEKMNKKFPAAQTVANPKEESLIPQNIRNI